MITKEFEQIIKKVGLLPEDQQKALARMIEEELRWDETIKNTQSELAELAEDALAEYRSGRTKKGDW
ncbi:MAG: hypothetical protein WD077_12505 [Bacteroidia bacterium]